MVSVKLLDMIKPGLRTMVGPERSPVDEASSLIRTFKGVIGP